MDESFRRTAFVLMPFTREFDDLYHLAIKEACKQQNVECSRVDEHIFTGLIINKIYSEISSSDIIIADMSTQNPNVFYEVGYAHALSKPTILLARDADDIPFDLKMHRHVIYGNSVRNAKLLLADELVGIAGVRGVKEYSLANIEISLLRPRKNKKYTVDNFIHLLGGEGVALREGLHLQVPGELSSFARGFLFEFGMKIKNQTGDPIDLGQIECTVTFPEGVRLGDGALKLGAGRGARRKSNGAISFAVHMTGEPLLPGREVTKILELNSTAVEDSIECGVYRTSFPVEIAVALGEEYWVCNIMVEIAPWRRLN